MTTIAVKVTKHRIEIASDSQITAGWRKQQQGNKVFSKLATINGMIIGSSGSVEEATLFQMYCQTHKPSHITDLGIVDFLHNFTNWKGERMGIYDLENQYILIIDDNVYSFYGFAVTQVLTYDAIGSGADYALAALYLGNSAELAVEVATELDLYSMKPVQVISKDIE